MPSVVGRTAPRLPNMKDASLRRLAVTNMKIVAVDKNIRRFRPLSKFAAAVPRVLSTAKSLLKTDAGAVVVLSLPVFPRMDRVAPKIYWHQPQFYPQTI